MLRTVVATIVAIFATPIAVPHDTSATIARHRAHHLGACRSTDCDRHWYRAYWYSGYATYYQTEGCDSEGGGGTTASGGSVYFGEVAQSTLAFGTKIWIEPAIKGRHRFTVEDRFGAPQAPGRLDVWLRCGESIPNPSVRFRVIRS
jgi:hypothetical protein